MSAEIVELAEAVKDALNSASLSMAFTAERVYVPVRDIKDLTDLMVSVVPTGLTGAILDRSRRYDFSYTIDIGIQKRAYIVADLDALMLLVQEIVDLFRSASLAGFGAATVATVANQPIYVPQHLDEQRVFTSVVTLTFQQAR